ncbi:MAG: glycosyltransferase [Chloroflexi bacterium]|nr:glycosyltransferase [Chloroflexota bacterium]
MRIAYLTQSYPPVVSGTAVVVQGLAEGMAQRGHHVLVLTASENSKPYVVFKPGLTIHRFHSIRNPFRMNHYFALWPHTEILKTLREFAPDVIHSHDPFQFALSALTFCRQTGTFSMLTAHQLPWLARVHLPDWAALKDLFERMLWLYSARFLSRFNIIITPTRTIADEVFAQTGLCAQAIGYGLNPEFFYPALLQKDREAALRRRLGLPESVPVLLHVGRLDLDKNVDLVILAAARAMAHSNAHLVVVGDGTEKFNLAKLCHEIGIGTRSHFPGFMDRERELPDVFWLASLFVTASEIETQGLVLLEAAACGLPIVAVSATCIPEVVKDGINGYLASPGDLTGLAEHIQRLLANPALARCMGSAGSLLNRKFCLEKTLLTHETLYYQTFVKSQARSCSRTKD